ncbi:hypothetical protein L3X38_000955 [Prunus dulcis]|uniref:Glutathione S-transferase n=1 Tax=Prunus dulcis TaxID=3755 RepID=A0AAD4ZJV7_PRUDU|nr:hypothetical protein L3X38_000955 [Prunus dulcis]
MATDKVKLLGYVFSPFSRRVEWALKLKGIDYEYVEEDIFNKSPLLLQLNPVRKKVPVLVHGNEVVSESFTILEYIDETWKQNPLLPQDPYARAISRFWANFTEEKVLDAGFTALICSTGEQQEKALKSTIEALEHIEGDLTGKKILGGESIGYLDIAMGWISYWLPIWEEVGSRQVLEPSKFPATISWINKILSHPVIKDNLPPRDKAVAYFHGRRNFKTSGKT